MFMKQYLVYLVIFLSMNIFCLVINVWELSLLLQSKKMIEKNKKIPKKEGISR